MYPPHLRYLLLCALLIPALVSGQSKDSLPVLDKKWWKEAVVYQVYPRSFQDSDGDGIGDIKGLISRLDYIKSLGIDVVWLNPIYASPNADNGYDISNYDSIQPTFGTMQDFDSLLREMHKRGLKLVMDLVVNHSSDEHFWFKESRSARTNPYRSYYHWWPVEKGNPPFRPGRFSIDGSAWQYDSLTQSYYLHNFHYKQPDLNWENPKLRADIYAMMHRWLQKGVDGFRMDVIPFISKDTSFPVITEAFLQQNYGGSWDRYNGDGPHLHEYLREMNKEVLAKYDIMTVSEGAGVTKDNALLFVDTTRHELQMNYHFEGTNLGYLPDQPNDYRHLDPKGYSLIDFKNIYTSWDSVFAQKGWGTIYLGNHDQPRMVSKWGNDTPEFRELSSKLLSTFLLTMRGTVYYYAGDELGMTSIGFDSIADYRDIETKSMYERIKQTGGDLQDFMRTQKKGARENGRTPFQWSAAKGAGFTEGEPWIKINPNYPYINASIAQRDPNSTLHYFRKLVSLRKEYVNELVYGTYTLLEKENPFLYAYIRESDQRRLLILLNFSTNRITFNLGSGILFTKARLLLNNYPVLKNTYTLLPYQALVYELEKAPLSK